MLRQYTFSISQVSDFVAEVDESEVSRGDNFKSFSINFFHQSVSAPKDSSEKCALTMTEHTAKLCWQVVKAAISQIIEKILLRCKRKLNDY
jgi:hypothetical protein